MSYFDHIQCPSCRQRLDPEQLASSKGLSCPLCGVALTPTALFGLADAIVDPDEEPGPRSLDDLIPGKPPSTAPAASGALAAIQAMKKRR